MPKLLERARALMRLRRYSRRTEAAYVFWIRRFIRFHGLRHPAEMGREEVNAFLSHLASVTRVSASTQNQALCALLFLYRDLLATPFDWLSELERAPRSRHIPVVLSPEEIRKVMMHLTGTHWLMASLLYGSGLLLMECCTLRVKDIDFAYSQITVRDGKGAKDRVTVLPDSLAAPLSDHLARVRSLHERDLAKGHGRAPLPDALERKYPHASTEWRWQFAFPSAVLSPDRRTGEVCRFHAAAARCRRRSSGRRGRGGGEADELPHAAPLVRHAPAGGGLRHQDDTGAARPQGRVHDDDLHARAEEGREGRQKPRRHVRRCGPADLCRPAQQQPDRSRRS